MRRTGTVVAFVACGVVTAGALVLTQSPSKPASKVSVPPTVAKEIQTALDAYASGDDSAAQTWTKTFRGTANVGYLEPVIVKAQRWRRSDAAFVLEVALGAPFNWRTPVLLGAGRLMVTSRPEPLGANPSEDRFEVLWHQSALALVQASALFFVQQDYLDAIAPRFEDAARRGVTLETRLPLARAISAGTLCCWKKLPGEVATEIPSLSRGITLDRAVGLYATAADVPALRREALIRGGKLLYDAGRYADALVWFERVTGDTDPALAYVHHLTRGRVFDALNRPADAVAAYAEALSFVPNGQLAAIGRAAALIRSGRVEEAAAAALEARRMPAGRRDFDRLRAFNLADARFVPAWLAEIRRLRR